MGCVNTEPRKRSDPIEAQIARQIRVELAERGMEQGELADRAGLARSTMSRYLQGQRSMTVKTFANVAEALGKLPSDLLKRAANLKL